MRIGIIIETNEPEKAWNGVRFGNAARKNGHEVRIFLISAGVEIERLSEGKFNVRAQLDDFAGAGGELMACGTCLKARDQAGSEVCPVSTMQDCIDMVVWADRTVTF
jgi:uncharacterized protein involved in oxidation of intracellular sulfur